LTPGRIGQVTDHKTHLMHDAVGEFRLDPCCSGWLVSGSARAGGERGKRRRANDDPPHSRQS
jgi:hypothetical protein